MFQCIDCHCRTLLLDGLPGARITPLCDDLAGEGHELLYGVPLEVTKLL